MICRFFTNAQIEQTAQIGHEGPIWVFGSEIITDNGSAIIHGTGKIIHGNCYFFHNDESIQSGLDFLDDIHQKLAGDSENIVRTIVICAHNPAWAWHWIGPTDKKLD